jgi:cell division transport system permease protein
MFGFNDYGIFLAFIAVLLINSSLRLSILNRFIIKTMQMVGATKSFIRKPFVMRSMGMLGAGLAIALIGVLLRRDSFPDLGILDNKILQLFY